MCVLYLGFQAHPFFDLVAALNRDEFYGRPTEPAHFWKEAPQVLAGRDLQAGGTWAGVTRQGRFAFLTNIRDPAQVKHDAPSRGRVVADFLTGQNAPAEYLLSLLPRLGLYSPFNLIVGQAGGPRAEAWYLNTRQEKPLQLEPGIYGLSNELLDSSWPKVVRGKRRFSEILNGATQKNIRPAEADLFELLADHDPALDAELPDTGVGLQLERMLSPIFIRSEKYGTRASNLLFIGSAPAQAHAQVEFVERTFVAPVDGSMAETRPQEETRFQFSLKEA